MIQLLANPSLIERPHLKDHRILEQGNLWHGEITIWLEDWGNLCVGSEDDIEARCAKRPSGFGGFHSGSCVSESYHSWNIRGGIEHGSYGR
jgi:hypothetical protein